MAGKANQCVVGVDYGTLSGRAVVVRAGDGEELGVGEFEYPHGVMERRLDVSAEDLPAGWALQDPDDYIEVLRHAVPEAIEAAGVDPSEVAALGTDFTSCTILPTTEDGTPLCQVDQFRERPHAYVKLWKHHAAQPQADRVTESRPSAKSRGCHGTADVSRLSGHSPRRCRCSTRIQRSTSAWTGGSKPRIGSSGGCVGKRYATPAAPVTRRCTRTVTTRAGSTSRPWTSALERSPQRSCPRHCPISAAERAVDALGKDVVFWIYAAFAAVGILFVRFLVPETKDRPLEDIDEYWTHGRQWPERSRSRESRGAVGAKRSAPVPS